MSRGNDHAGAKAIREHNVTIFQNFKKKLVGENLQNDPVKWIKVAHTLLVFLHDVRIYYDEARPDIADCVEIATGAVMSVVPAEIKQLGSITTSHLPEPYRFAYDELKRLLVVVGSYQPEILNPPKGGDSKPDVLSRIISCIAAFGIDPDTLLDKPSLEAVMQNVALDGKSRKTILKAVEKRQPDALSGVSSARSAPYIATPVLSVASTPTTAAPPIAAPITPTAYSGPTPKAVHVAVPHVPSQVLVQQTVSPVVTHSMLPLAAPTTLVSPVRPIADAPKPRKQPKWMARDLDIFRQEKMANAGAATAKPPGQQPTSPAVTHHNVVPLSQPPAAAQELRTYAAHLGPSTLTTVVSPDEVTAAPHYRTPGVDVQPAGATASQYRPPEAGARPVEVAEVGAKSPEAMDVDTPLLDEHVPPEDKPLPYTLPPGPHSYSSTPTWNDLFVEAINAAHEHKLSIGDMIRYIATVYPDLKGTKHAVGAAFNSRMARQTGKATPLAGTVMDDLRLAKSKAPHSATRFVRTADVYPVTWTIEGLDMKLGITDVASAEAESVIVGEPAPVCAKQGLPAPPAETPIAAPEDLNATSDAPLNSAHDAPSTPYTLRPGPYSPAKPTEALTVLVQEAILAGRPEKALTQSAIIAYVSTVYPFYASYPNLEDEVFALLRQHFAPNDDGRWSLWIRDGADMGQPVPFTIPLSPRTSTKPDKSLRDLIREAMSASNEGCLTQRDVAAYVLSIAPYYNGADEPFPFGQLLRDHFVQRGSDAEGRALWAMKAETSMDEDEQVTTVTQGGKSIVTEVDNPTPAPVTPVVADSESRASSRPLKDKGPPKSASIVVGDDEQDSDMETPDPVTSSTATAAAVIPSPAVQAPPPPARLSAARLFDVPSGPYTSHKPSKSNEQIVIEALRASKTDQVRKKDIVLYLQTVYPWYQRDERAIVSCQKMVEHIMARLKGTWVSRISTGLYRVNDVGDSAGTSSTKEREVAQDEDMDDAALTSTAKPSSPVLKIRIPVRKVSGDTPTSATHKRSAPPSSSARSETLSLPKRIKLIVQDKPGAASPIQAENNGAAYNTPTPSIAPSADRAPKPQTNGVSDPDPEAEREAAVSPLGGAADVEMQDGPAPLPPVSFGQDACLVDVAFGRPVTASFGLHVHPCPAQWEMLERWRNAAGNDNDVSDALCYSLACFRSEDVHAVKDDGALDSWGNVLVRSEIPVSLHSQGLQSLCLTGNVRTIPFPLTWMTATTSPLFLDISSYLVPGDNELILSHTADLSAFTFVVVAHRPNPHQLRWLNARREPWRRLQAQISNAMQVPQLDFSALLLLSKDVSKVDLDRGVPKELSTLS